jgi:hypothetical protein
MSAAAPRMAGLLLRDLEVVQKLEGCVTCLSVRRHR